MSAGTPSSESRTAIVQDGTATVFAQPRGDLLGASLGAKVAGKLSRFLARRVPTRPVRMRNARPLVSFTFDDVPASACVAGARILEAHGARGTFYVSGGGCGSVSPGGRLATAGELKELRASGHEIGCHTYSHYAVARVSTRELAADLDRNRSFLDGVGPQGDNRNFAYPYGDFSFRRKLQLDGQFASCRTLIPGINAGKLDLGMLKNCALEDASIDRPGITGMIAETMRRNGWIILSSHDVDERPSRFGVSPGLLEFAVEAAIAAGCQVVTITDGLRLARGASLEGKQALPGRQSECVR